MNEQYDRYAISPDREFEDRLRAELEARLGALHQSATELTKEIDIVTVQADATRSRRPQSRLPKIALAAVAAIALVVAAAIITKRVNDDQTASTDLHDVDAGEALPFGQDAFITADALGSRWRPQEMFTESMYTDQTAATIAAMPECAMLRSVGLFTPTTKSVAARQSFSPGRNFVGHTVFVFATEQDASRAMDIIAGDVYPTCWFDFFDRLIPLGATLGTSTSTSEAWDAPDVAAHGDRQVIIGQHSTLVAPDATVDAYFINAYVQVGRAISWIDPMTGPSADNAGFAADKAIAATATALERVFGQ